MKNMLIVARQEKGLVALDRTSDRPSKLVLLIGGTEADKGRRRSTQRTVAQVIKRTAVPLIRPRLGHHIDDCAPSPPRLRSIAARLHPELLHHLVRKLVGRAIPSHRLRKKSVVVVSSIHQKARVVSANPAVGKIPVRSRRQPSRILRHARRQQEQIRVPASIQRQVLDRPLIQQPPTPNSDPSRPAAPADTVIVSMVPPTFSLNVNCVAAPTSTRITGEIFW